MPPQYRIFAPTIILTKSVNARVRVWTRVSIQAEPESKSGLEFQIQDDSEAKKKIDYRLNMDCPSKEYYIYRDYGGRLLTGENYGFTYYLPPPISASVGNLGEGGGLV